MPVFRKVMTNTVPKHITVVTAGNQRWVNRRGLPKAIRHT